MPKMSFIVPCLNDADSIPKYFESILDQDYKDWECIAVNDGSSDNSWKVIQKYVKKYPDKIRGINFETNRGACAARNEGAKYATGEYISFLPADAQLFPGMLRIWVESLEENPQYEFLYGGYQFIDDYGNHAQDYISQPFDPYLLEVNNYIDGSFPLKRELFEKMGGWDASVKSLQDWDFWLTAVKKFKARGLYIADMFFKTTLPHPGGLSYDSANNWIARTDYIKAKQGIPDRKICVCAPGARFHGINVAKMLDADYKDVPSFKPHKYKMIYLMGVYYTLFPNIVDAFKRHDGLRVAHWIGSDIFQLQDLKRQNSTQADMALNSFLNYLSHNIDVHYCEFEQTQRELKEFGINARIQPVPPKNEYEIMSLPEKESVAIYNPQVNKAFYYPDLCHELAQKTPSIEFNFFGDPILVGKKDNINHLGQLDDKGMRDLIERSSVILRLTLHDGLPLSVAEFIEAGRNAITTVPMMYSFYPKDLQIETLQKALGQCKEKGLNVEGSEYYRKIMNKDCFKKVIYDLFEYDVKKYWEARARSWDITRGDGLDAEYLPKIESFINEIKPKNCLELGAGNGNYAQWLAEHCCGNYIGIDIAQELVDKAKLRHPNYEFICSSILDYQVSEPRDLIFTFTALLHIPPVELQKHIDKIKTMGKYGIFIEPVMKIDKNTIVERRLAPEMVKEITENQKIIQGVESSFIHDYDKYFEVIKKEIIGARAIYLVKLAC